MSQITGIVYVKVDGALQESKEGAKLTLGGKEREAKTGYKVYGYSEKVVPAQVEFSLFHKKGVDLQDLQNKVDSTIEFETDTGDTYLIANAFATKPAELDGASGEVALVYQGDPAELV